MQMRTDDLQTYPRFTKYVTTSLPGMANVKSIISAIESISEFGDTGAIKGVLSWDHGPMVEGKILVDKQIDELTHWAREQAGKSEDEDLGFVFEKEIYGGIVTD